jgi:hypothetical protein
MRNLSEMTVIHIDVTNACHLRCANCTRHLGHHNKPFFMDMDTIEKAIDSLIDFPGRIGIMGGEPVMHPNIKDIIELISKKTERRKRQIWTAGFKWDDYKDIFYKHFDRDLITFNDHTAPGKHQPMLVSINDVIDNKELANELIDNCWVQEQWSASITPKGGFFCEVAASLDYLLDGPGGVKIEKNWWKKSLNEFQNQIKSNCSKCSACIPLETESDGFGGRTGPTVDTISKSNYDLLKNKSLKVKKGHYKIMDQKLSDEDIIKNSFLWSPSRYRDFISHKPEDSSKYRLISPSEKIKAR